MLRKIILGLALAAISPATLAGQAYVDIEQ